MKTDYDKSEAREASRSSLSAAQLSQRSGRSRCTHLLASEIGDLNVNMQRDVVMSKDEGRRLAGEPTSGTRDADTFVQ